jgi:heptosyltransferase-2
MKPTVVRPVLLAPNWLGDAVMALPAIADLRRAWPDTALTVAARPGIAPLFTMVPFVDSVLPLDVARTTMPSFDTAVLLPNSFHAALRTWRAGIPERWGYRTDWRRALLTRAVEAPSGLHQVAFYQHLVKALGFPTVAAAPRVTVSDTLAATAARELVGAGWDGRRPLVGLAPGAAYGGAKRWPPAYFAELAGALARDGVQSVVVGSTADLPVAREIEGHLGTDVVLNLMGTDLPTLAAILAACRAVVLNDSGAMHLAAAVGTHVTAVFGPTDERITRPFGDGHVVLAEPVWCRPCLMRECPIDHRCMRGVGVDRVAGAVRQML